MEICRRERLRCRKKSTDDDGDNRAQHGRCNNDFFACCHARRAFLAAIPNHHIIYQACLLRLSGRPSIVTPMFCMRRRHACMRRIHLTFSPPRLYDLKQPLPQVSVSTTGGIAGNTLLAAAFTHSQSSHSKG
jgi:hypothetical protein